MDAGLPEPGEVGGPVEPGTLDRRWRNWAWGAIVAGVSFGALAGFLVLPAFQRENAGLDWWTAICRAVGITEGSPAYRQPVTAAVAAPVSQVAWSPDVLQILNNARPERGQALAIQQCGACHGETGVSVLPGTPSLVGQSSAAIYKQLDDYRSGARFDPQMTPVAAGLTVPTPTLPVGATTSGLRSSVPCRKMNEPAAHRSARLTTFQAAAAARTVQASVSN